jgi:hypothetical protein
LRGLLGGTIAAAIALALPSSALATFHLMSVSEVFPGSAANSGQDFVELQMYSSGQDQVGGKTVTVYAANGTVADTATFGSDVGNGANNSTILVGAAASVVGVTPDLVDSGFTAISPAGGAVCWVTVDCVAWGSFTPPLGGLPSPTGAPEPAIPDGSSITRDISAHCATLFENADDTDDSAADFNQLLPSPRANATTPTEQACPNTTITDGPSGKTKDRTPTFKFKSTPSGADFECKLDSGSFESCTSPDTLAKQSFGSHTFSVRAVDGPRVDQSPAKRKFKVIKRH